MPDTGRYGGSVRRGQKPVPLSGTDEDSRGSAADHLCTAIAYYENTPPRGEYVLVVAGAVPQKAESVTLEEAVEQVRRCVADGQKLTQACKTVAAETGYRKSELYDAVQES